VLLVDRVSESIDPDATNEERSVVDVTILYCTALPAGCGDIVPE
jgi:hypothetical protein